MIIGITGGTGCGKSTCASLMKTQLNATLIDLDIVGHEVLQDPNIKSTLISTFGPSIINANTAEIDRPKLGQIVFSNQHHLDILNRIMHPKIKQNTITIITQHQNSPIPMIIEGALIEKIGLRPYCTYLISIDAPIEKRQQLNPKKWNQIAKHQPTQDEYNKSATHILHNPYTQEFKKNISELIKKLSQCNEKAEKPLAGLRPLI